MIDPKTILDQFLGSKVPGTEQTVSSSAEKAGQMAKDNPLATGLLAAVLLGTGAGRSLTGSALKIGGLAAVAGLGYRAWQNYQAGKAPSEAAVESRTQNATEPPPLNSGFAADSGQLATPFALALVRVMIGAARADGHIDDSERQRIRDKLATAGLGSEAITFLDSELSRPVDLDALIAEANSDAEKVEMYTAARLAIEPDTRAERGFLDLLAGRLALPEALIEHIEATVSSAKR
ncbi:tellurite resistance TerB family protein [Pseudohoeflea coraliihabitans]|uniref:Tellurite resistance TerB family protein n=1 Tax=Pseudohoeflea coraliihabitans TaxID=2860393 RepID=A0ABS6WL60_9HYPH|nr:tellurite resistance TerB family protein [Pseudohoeflea sp. DP4N28-3]MBW3096393.1 tellurite resistance TerB family protein [Pseudohoeflea sp. DP4N28-3]